MERISKPKVFLSHSAQDKKFIKFLAEALRDAKIEFWLDQYEIRDGKPWMKMIFEDGLPSCHAILVYLTENSIESKMVQKEIDSALLEELEENNIAFLPYVENGRLRKKLRVDLRTLHCRELNEENFQKIFPSIVSEVWMSYLEQKTEEIRIREKVKKQEIESKYRKLKKRTIDTPFSKSQNKDYKYLYDELNTPLKFTVDILDSQDNENHWHKLPIKSLEGEISFVHFFIHFLRDGGGKFEKYRVWNFLKDYIFETEHMKEFDEIRINSESSLRHIELRSFGLINSTDYEKEHLTNKAYRFNYWMGFNGLIDDELNLKINRNE